MSDTDTPHTNNPQANEEEAKDPETTFSALLKCTESTNEENLSIPESKNDTDSPNGESEKNQEQCKSLPSEQSEQKNETW